jgi:hypothetical protein
MANKYTKQHFDIERAISLYESGLTQSEVAHELGTTQKVVWGRFRESGYKCRKAKKRNQYCELNSSWKGNTATKEAFHYRLKSLFGSPKICEICGTSDLGRTYDWANITGRYEDPQDYKRMCRSCHWKYDQKHLNFKGAVGGRKGGDSICQSV